MKIYTIGFTQKPAERFFRLLRENGVRRVLDIRLRPGGQLAGFAKGDDLAYFLRSLVNCDYVHLDQLAPTDDILKDYRVDHDWPRYVRRFDALLDDRGMPNSGMRELLEQLPGCLLCSEAAPDRCHRRLVAERMARCWPDSEVVHLI
jgi:uncharacterized protein (DUF488 family)